MNKVKVGILASHPIQYQAPLFRALAKQVDLKVYFSHRVSPQQQGEAGFGVPFEWDIDLLSGYQYLFLSNQARKPGVNNFFGCNTPEIKTEIKDAEFDVFIVNGWHLLSYWQAIFFCKKKGIPILIRGDSQLPTKRSFLKRLVKEIVYRKMIKVFDGYLIVGNRARNYLLHYGADSNKMFKVPHFVDNDWFRNKVKISLKGRNNLKKALGIDNKSIILLFVGKFIEKKRPIDLIKAVSLSNQYKDKIEVIFVGSGKLDHKIRTASEKLGIRVHMTGFKNQTELLDYYSLADILVLPSDGGETWGLVVNEAMACSVPVIVSDAVGCAPDLVEPGKTGEIYSMGNIASLMAAIERLIPLLKSSEINLSLKRKIDQYSVQKGLDGIMSAINFFVKKPKY